MIGQIARILVVRTEVDRFVAGLAQVLGDLAFQLVTGVIAGERNPHLDHYRRACRHSVRLLPDATGSPRRT